MSREAWHRDAAAAARALETGDDWLGLVASPTSPDAVPVVSVPDIGLTDTLTFARGFVLATIPLAEYRASRDDDTWSGQVLQKVSDAWELVAEPLTTSPSTGTLAAVIVALQHIALEAGREWIALGFGRDRIHTMWGTDTATDEPDDALFSWVARRWDAEPDANDDCLLPHRVLALDLDKERLFRVTKGLAYLIADFEIAAQVDHEWYLHALHDGHRDRAPRSVRAVAPRSDPWAPLADDEPPF
jgi:hypothetical protein